MACDLFWTRPFPCLPLSETLPGGGGPLAQALLFARRGCV